jgi:NADPH:quinone reductase-like Zn-dependent oxidoreductase
MRAAVVDRYGPPEVVRVTEVPRPSPGADQVRVRVRAVAVTSGDARIRAARFPPGFGLFARPVFGIRGPRRKILGTSFSGEVATIGARVHGFAPGDEVCGMTGMAMGAHAEYVAVAARRLTRKPPGVAHDAAAGVLFGGTTALFFLRDKASIGAGMSVFVNGASGAVGTNAVQLAKHFGATVAGVTGPANAALVAELGADRVVDYSRDDLASIADRFDVVFDAVGNVSITSGRRLLTDRGKLLLAVASLGDTLRARGGVVAGSAPERVEDFELLLRLVAAGELTVVIDGIYELDDIGEAHRRVDSGHKVGNVIVHL